MRRASDFFVYTFGSQSGFLCLVQSFFPCNLALRLWYRLLRGAGDFQIKKSHGSKVVADAFDEHQFGVSGFVQVPQFLCRKLELPLEQRGCPKRNDAFLAACAPDRNLILYV